MGSFEIVVRAATTVARRPSNEPLLDNGRPMPTRFWLADRALNKAIGRIESEGAVDHAERDPHRRHRRNPRRLRRGPRRPAAARSRRPAALRRCWRHSRRCEVPARPLRHPLAGNDDAGAVWLHPQRLAVDAAFDPSEPGIMTIGIAVRIGRAEIMKRWHGAASMSVAAGFDPVAVIDLGTISTRSARLARDEERHETTVTRTGEGSKAT